MDLQGEGAAPTDMSQSTKSAPAPVEIQEWGDIYEWLVCLRRRLLEEKRKADDLRDNAALQLALVNQAMGQMELLTDRGPPPPSVVLLMERYGMKDSYGKKGDGI